MARRHLQTPIHMRFVLLLLGALVGNVSAEQMQVFSDYEVHYIVLPTTFLQPEIATNYNLPRGRDRALVNVSVLDAAGKPVHAEVTGSSANLLGQKQVLTFTEVAEGEAIYYLALLRHADEEYQRVALDIVLPGGELGEIRFQQQMFWDR